MWSQAKVETIPQVEAGIHANDQLSLEATISNQMLEINYRKGKDREQEIFVLPEDESH